MKTKTKVSREDMDAYAKLMRKLPVHDRTAELDSEDELIKRALDAWDARIDGEEEEPDVMDGLLSSVKVRRLKEQ